VLLWDFETSGESDPGGYNFALWDIFDPAAGAYGDSATLLANAQATVAAAGSRRHTRSCRSSLRSL